MRIQVIVLSVVLSLCGVAWAEAPVYFADPLLKAAVEDTLWIVNPTPTDMLGLTSLEIDHVGITDLTGLEYAANLQTLLASGNSIRDLSPLSGLTNLEWLVLHGNHPSDTSPLSGLVNLRTLDMRDTGTHDISFVSGLVNLRLLRLNFNGISGIPSLAGLTHLEHLLLNGNPISDISGLAGLATLRILNLDEGQISDISTLATLTSLTDLNLFHNQVTDVSPLTRLTTLQYVDLRENPLNDASFDIYIPQIKEKNPSLRSIKHDHGPFRLVISSTAGGSVIQPGEGEFIISDGKPVVIEAKPDPGFAFTGFSGFSLSTTENPISLKLSTDYTVQARFQTVLDALWVDDDAAGDPKPSDATVSDPQENGTQEHPFDSVQEAITVARDGISIFVRPGTYQGTIDLLGRNVCLSGLDPAMPGTAAYPILDGGDHGPVLVITGHQEPNCVVEGFVITGGKDAEAGAILCSNSSPTFVHCLIVGNRSSGPGGAAIRCTNSNAVVENCTLADNYGGPLGIGVRLINSDVTFINSVLWNNGRYPVIEDGMSSPAVDYCDIQGGWTLTPPGLGNIDADPLFVQCGRWVDRLNPSVTVQPDAPNALWAMGDYHMRSQAGRWDALANLWVLDAVTSPCIDAGDPASPVGQEPSPNGGRVDLGAYGGTAQASKSPLVGF
jgi:hypothetical protein